MGVGAGSQKADDEFHLKLDFSLPCKVLCKKNLRRPHLTCLTCLERRYYYNKINRNEYVKMKENHKFMVAIPNRGIVIPKHSNLYFLLINTNGNALKRRIKRFILKRLLSVAELIANW